MSAFRIRAAALAVTASIGLSACMGPYGYGGVGVGYGNGYGYDPYYANGYGYPAGGYGYGYEPYYGWYDGFYYPGTGYYVYDRYRNPYPWNDDQRHHWEHRREQGMSSEEFRRQMEAHRDQQNWSGFDQGPAQIQRVRSSDGAVTRVERTSRPSRVERQSRSTKVERSANRVERSADRTERSTARSERRSSRQSASDFRRSMEKGD